MLKNDAPEDTVEHQPKLDRPSDGLVVLRWIVDKLVQLWPSLPILLARFIPLDWSIVSLTLEAIDTRSAKKLAEVDRTDWNFLSGKQARVLRDAIRRSFPKVAGFDIFLSDELNRGPVALKVEPGGYDDQLFEYLRHVQAEGWTRELIEALQRTNRPLLKNIGYVIWAEQPNIEKTTPT